MTQDERARLIKANQELLKRRQAIAKPVTLTRPALSLVERNGQTAADQVYLETVNDAEAPVLLNPARQTIEGRRVYWDNFDSDRHPALQAATRQIRCWYNERLDQGGALVLAGNYGCGKTHLAKAVWELFGTGAVFWNETQLCKTIQGGYGGGGRSEESIYTGVRRAKLFILDDLGGYPTQSIDWIQSIYYNLFDGRLEAQAATFITTNLPLQAGLCYPFEERTGSRVFSRLVGQMDTLDYFVDLFGVPDYRKRNFKAGAK